jgi:hypothetical protein
MLHIFNSESSSYWRDGEGGELHNRRLYGRGIYVHMHDFIFLIVVVAVVEVLGDDFSPALFDFLFSNCSLSSNGIQ